MLLCAQPLAPPAVHTSAWRRPRRSRCVGLRTLASATAPAPTTQHASGTYAQAAQHAGLPRRHALVASLAAALLLRAAPPALSEAAFSEAAFSAGDPVFLEHVYDDLRYKGVKDVVPGAFGPVRGVRVLYNADKISYEDLLRAYWREAKPTQADGQYESRGPANASVIWAATPEQRAAAEQTRDALQRSGVYGNGGAPLATQVRDLADVAFEAWPEEQRGFGRKDAKKLEQLRGKTGRTAFYDATWGLTTFCEGRVCGYVRFAKACTGECLTVFPEYREQEGTYKS